MIGLRKRRRSLMVTYWVAVVRIRVQVPKWKLEFLVHNTLPQFQLGCVRREIIGWFGYSISHVQPLSQTPLRRASFITGDLIWDTCHTRWGWCIRAELPRDNVSCHNVFECGAWAGPNGYTKVSRPTLHDHLGSKH